MRKLGLAWMVAAALIASGCNNGPDKLTWTSEHSRKCLSLPVTGGYNSGDPAEQWDCSHYHMGLQASWLLEPVSGAAKTFRMISIHSGMCLEVNASGGGKNNGDPLQQAACTTADNQKWILNPAAGATMAGSWTFQSVHSGKCMQVRFGTTGGLQDGDSIEQGTCVAGAKNQIWAGHRITAPNPPLSTGKGELCNLCNPANPDCNPGALCLILLSGQSVCGQSCTAAADCPDGYECTKITQLGKTYFQCVPEDNSCPYEE